MKATNKLAKSTEPAPPSAAAAPPRDPPKGIPCRRCGCCHWYVVYVQRLENRIRRRRECRHCGLRVTTYEQRAGLL